METPRGVNKSLSSCSRRHSAYTSPAALATFSTKGDVSGTAIRNLRTNSAPRRASPAIKPTTRSLTLSTFGVPCSNSARPLQVTMRSEATTTACDPLPTSAHRTPRQIVIFPSLVLGNCRPHNLTAAYDRQLLGPCRSALPVTGPLKGLGFTDKDAAGSSVVIATVLAPSLLIQASVFACAEIIAQQPAIINVRPSLRSSPHATTQLLKGAPRHSSFPRTWESMSPCEAEGP